VSDESEAGEGRAVPPAANTPDEAIDAVTEDASVEAIDEAAGDLLHSDEVESELDRENTDSVRESALVGAAAGSARAAARRSGVRAGSTLSKGTPTKSRDAVRTKRVSIFGRLRRFLREVVSELRKVIWPARNQMVTYTIVVIVFVVFMVALTGGLDVLFAKGVLAIFG